jgi:hypothetical protein
VARDDIKGRSDGSYQNVTIAEALDAK